MAPEMFLRLEDSSKLNFDYGVEKSLVPVDVWGCGVVLIFMLTGRNMGEGSTEVFSDSYKTILTSDFGHLWSLLGASDNSDLVKDLMASMMHPNPAQRPPLSQILHHTWLDGTPGCGRLVIISCITNQIFLT
jgi:serine/threonine protein kinase